MKTLLWLDDLRNPYENDGEWLMFSPISGSYEIIWVKNYIDFIEYIYANGLPTAICFDHDLGPIEEVGIESGFDCAKFLVEYCMDNDFELPLWGVQSANPVGKDNINGLLNNYLKHNG